MTSVTSRGPAGEIPVDVPPEAPSRAYAKIEEAIAWAGLPVECGHVALEIGAAPGGAVLALALARRGVEVWGVDSAELAPQVLAQPGVHHLKMKVGALRWEDLPGRIDWLLVDLNLAPQVALHEVARRMPRLKKTLRGAVIWQKLKTGRSSTSCRRWSRASSSSGCRTCGCGTCRRIAASVCGSAGVKPRFAALSH